MEKYDNAMRHRELLELVSAIWRGEANYYDHDAEMKELYLLGSALSCQENADVIIIGKRTKQIVREIEEYVVLRRYYDISSKQIQKSSKTLRKIMNSMVQAIIRVQGGEVNG